MASTRQQHPAQGNGRNPWDVKQRTILHLLHDPGYGFDSKTRTAIFNRIFADYQRANGIFNGLPDRTLNSQYAMRKDARGVTHWNAICMPPSSPEEVKRRNVLANDITTAAKAVHSTTPPNIVRTSNQATVQKSSTTTLSRKRTADREPDSDERLDDEDYTPMRPKAKRVRRVICNAIVSIPNANKPELIYSPALDIGLPNAILSPPKTPKTRRVHANILHPRLSGDAIFVTSAELKQIKEPFVPATEAEGRPLMAPLLFRFWGERSQSPLVNGQFIASQYRSTNIAPPPLPPFDSKYWNYALIENHLDGDKVNSPFISLSNNLVWIFRLAYREAAKGNLGYCTLVNAAALDQQNVFYIPPFQREMRKRRAMKDGAQRYPGSHEWLVHYKVPREAILTSFKFADVVHLKERDQAVNDLLRLEHLSQQGDYRTKTLPQLKEASIKLSPDIIKAIAKIARVVGLSPNSEIEHLSHIVADIIRGEGLVVEYSNDHAWAEKAAVFSHYLCRKSPVLVTFRDQQKVKLAFLDGVRWGLGNFNPRHSLESMAKMQRAANRVGLEHPAKILASEMDGAKLHLYIYAKQQERLIKGAHPAPLADVEEDDGEQKTVIDV